MRCSRIQEALWLAEEVAETGAAANMPLVVELQGTLDTDRLAAALAAVVKAQPALRTRFRMQDGRLERVEVPGAAPELPVEPADRPVEELVAARSRVPLRMTGELARYSLLRLAPDRHLLHAMAHHAVFDGLSKERLVGDLARAYAGLPPAAAPPAYDRYVEAERRHVEALADAAERYWRPVLARLPTAARWPASPHAAPHREARGEALRFELDAAFRTRLEQVATAENASLFALLTSAVQALQRIYAGRSADPVAALLPMSTRPREMAAAIGMFVNEVPIVSDPAAAGRFSDLVAHVSAGLGALMPLRHFPFNEAVARFGPGRDPQALLPRVGISYWRTRSGPLVAGGVRFVADHQVSVFGRRWDVRFRFLEHAGGLSVGIEHDTAVLHPAGARRLAGHLRTLLERVLAAPDIRLDELDVLSGEERHRIAVGWNATEADLAPLALPELFEARARRHPDREAMVAGEDRATYGELDARANEIARRLGAGRGDLVAICLKRGVDLVAALLGVAKAGAAFLPLDPAHPAARRELMLRDGGARLVIDERWLADGGSPAEPRAPAGLDDRAYTIFTSGSTGIPKGIEITHGALSNLLQSICREPGLTSADTQLAVASVAFDLALLELFAPLVAGARLVVAAEEDVADGEALAALLERHAVTYVHATPATWRLLLAAGWRGRLRTAVSGAEPLTPSLARELLERADALWNSYGPTETTIGSTVQRIHHHGRIAIGRPIANTQLLVMDAAARLVPPGVPGELYIGGAGVARGYRGRPELTRERFVHEPLPGLGRFYRSGDLVRQRDDGAVDYLRRLDDQLKIRGFRIEPGEIESALADLAGVREALVVGAGPPEDRRLVAYLTADGERAPAIAALRQGLALRLPAHMIPSAFVVLDRFPVTGSGKVDRRRLPAPEPVAHHTAETRPRTTTETTLAAIWTAALPAGRLGVHDNFFELGGHSLLAAEVAARASDAMERHVPVRLLFRHPTIAGLAAALEAGAPAAAIVPVPRTRAAT